MRGEREGGGHPGGRDPGAWKAFVRRWRGLRAAGLRPGAAVVGARAVGRTGADPRFVAGEPAGGVTSGGRATFFCEWCGTGPECVVCGRGVGRAGGRRRPQ